MAMLVGSSFYLLAMVCIGFGIIWLVRGKARVFYFVNVEGLAARIASLFIIGVGIAIFCFAFFVLPTLLPEDLLNIR